MTRRRNVMRVFASAAIAIVCLVAVLGCSDGTSTDAAAAREPTATATPPLRISAPELWDAREANPLRFDDTYKGNWVQIYGVVGEIDGGEVRLEIVESPFVSFVYIAYIAPT